MIRCHHFHSPIVCALSALAITSLSGCQPTAPENHQVPITLPREANPGPMTQINGDVRARMIGFAPAQREAVLRRAIVDAGGDCQKITSALRDADMGQNLSWQVACGSHSAWLVIVSPDGMANIVPIRGRQER
jgi:hypothetical protein